MITKPKSISVVAALLLGGSLFFGGCGGGGGDTATVSTAGVELTGTAVDELILNGVVEVRDGSASGNIIGSGRTSTTDGTYTIDVGNFSGVAVVKVTCDANSQLYFPKTDTTQQCPTQTELYSAAPVEAQKVTVNIAPATHVMFMMATGGDITKSLDKAEVEEARQITANIFGADPITDDPTDGVYASVIEAFHEAADNAGLSIQEFVESVATDAADGVLGDDDPQLVADLAQSMKDNSVTTELVTAIVDDNQTTYVPDDSPILDDIAAAKALFASLRSQAYSLYSKDGDAGVLYDEANGVKNALQNATLNTTLAGLAIGNIASGVLTAIDSNLTTYQMNVVTLNGDTRDINLTRVDLDSTEWSYRFIDTRGGVSEDIATGTLNLPSANPSDINISSFGTLVLDFNGELPETYFSDQTQAVQSFTAQAEISQTDVGADINVSEISITSSTGTSLGIKGFSAEIGFDYNASNTTDPVTLNFVKLNEVTIDGAIDQNYTASGTLEVDYTTNSTMASYGGFNEVWTTTLQGKVACIDQYDSQLYSDYGNSGFSINLGDASYHINTDADGYFRTEIDGEYYDNDLQNAQFSFDTNCSDGVPTFEWIHTSANADMEIGNGGFVPNRLELGGEVANTASGTGFTGSVTVELLDAGTIDINSVNEDTDGKFDVTISGKLQRESMDDMILNLSYKYDPATKYHEYTLGYSYGGTVANIDGDYNDTLKVWNIDINSGAGVSISLVVDDNIEGKIDLEKTSALTKDGKEIGRLERVDDLWRIKYYDGSFESLY